MGLLTLCYSELVPIQLFGLYSAIGVVFSLLFLFFYMPAAFERWPLANEVTGPAPKRLRSIRRSSKAGRTLAIGSSGTIC